MQDIPTKSTGDSLTAAEFNQIPDELENAILSTGQTLSGADLFQLAKAIAHYTANGNAYTDSGAADAYVLGVIGSNQPIQAYDSDAVVRFQTANVNTGASTINVAGIGVVDIRQADGTVLLAGMIPADTDIELAYNTAGGYFVFTAKNAMGVGQKWQDVSGSRAKATTYTNTTGREITVLISAVNSSAGQEIALTVDGVSLSSDSTGLAGTAVGITAPVPPGKDYSVDAVGGVLTSFLTWAELR